MRYIFFGSPQFAAIILEKLIDAGMPPVAIVCNPDRPFGRKKIITPPAVKARIMNYELEIRNKIQIFQPESASELNAIRSTLNALLPDLFVVAAYAKILPKEILDIPRLGTIGVHPSLLPKYRGATPIQNAILNGDKITGTTLYLMDAKVDHGSALAQRELNCELGIMNYETTEKKLAELSGELLVETLPDIESKIKRAEPQDETLATYTKKFSTEDAFVKPEDVELAQGGDAPELAVAIERKVRALNPEPGVWTTRDGKRLKLLGAEIRENKLHLKKIQYEGKKSETLSP